MSWFSRKKALFWPIVAALGLFLLAFDAYQAHAIARHFAPIAAGAGTREDLAVKFNDHVHALHRAHGNPEGEDTSSLAFRLPILLLERGGGCSQRALLLAVALREAGLPARKLLVGLTGDYAAHVVVEVELGGTWRVLDPLYGYAYLRDDGALASAVDLAKNPELIARVARSDPKPFPIPYRLDAHHYREVTRFNWFKFGFLRSARDWLGPSADAWEPPFVLNWPLTLVGWALLGVAVPVMAVGAYRRKRGAAPTPRLPAAARKQRALATKDG